MKRRKVPSPDDRDRRILLAKVAAKRYRRHHLRPGHHGDRQDFRHHSARRRPRVDIRQIVDIAVDDRVIFATFEDRRDRQHGERIAAVLGFRGARVEKKDHRFCGCATRMQKRDGGRAASAVPARVAGATSIRTRVDEWSSEGAGRGTTPPAASREDTLSTAEYRSGSRTAPETAHAFPPASVRHAPAACTAANRAP